LHLWNSDWHGGAESRRGLRCYSYDYVSSKKVWGALIAWGGILWATRTFRDEAAVRAVLQCTAVADAIGCLTAVMGTVSGTFNSMGWIAVAIYAFGTAGCVYFLSGEKKLAVV
jgi:hypothetical protein